VRWSFLLYSLYVWKHRHSSSAGVSIKLMRCSCIYLKLPYSNEWPQNIDPLKLARGRLCHSYNDNRAPNQARLSVCNSNNRIEWAPRSSGATMWNVPCLPQWRPGYSLLFEHLQRSCSEEVIFKSGEL
jgi:hypothetical protein